MNSKIKLLVFDYDGTLADTKGYYLKMMANYLKKDITDVYRIADQYLDTIIDHEESNVKWQIIKSFYQVPRRLKCSRLKSIKTTFFIVRNYKKNLHKATLTVDGHKGLEKLHQAGITMAIVSLSKRKKIVNFIKTNSLEKYFSSESIFAADDFHKSKVEALQKLLNRYQLTNNRHQCAMVGDLGGDIISGKEIGIKTFGLTTGFMNQKKLLMNDPDGIFNSILELANYLVK